MGAHVQPFDDVSGRTSKWKVRADRYAKAGALWLRFSDPVEDMGKTTTVVKIEPGRIKVIRQGGIRWEQTFVEREETAGYYQLPGGRVTLGMRTHLVDVRLDGGVGVVSWTYDLFTDGHLTGTYELKLVIQEDGS